MGICDELVDVRCGCVSIVRNEERGVFSVTNRMVNKNQEVSVGVTQDYNECCLKFHQTQDRPQIFL